MKKQIEIVFLKEIKDSLKKREFIISFVTIILLFTFIGFGIDYFLDNNSNIAEIVIILTPIFSMWMLSFSLIQEKFWNIKINNGFGRLLTLPVTIQDIWVGKIASIFVLCYPSCVLIVLILAAAYYLTLGSNPSTTIPVTTWIFIFIIGPLIIMVYNLISSWTILRFNNPRIIDIIQYIPLAIFISILVFYTKFSKLVVILNLTDETMIIGCIFIFGIITTITYHLIINLKKEDVVT